MSSSTEEQALAALQDVGAILKRSKRGTVLVVDFRPVAAQVTDDVLVHISALAGLREIYLDGTRVTDNGLSPLQNQSSLTTLDLQYTQITDVGLAELAQLRGLKLLLLTGSQVTQDAVKTIRKSMLNTRIVFLA